MAQINRGPGVGSAVNAGNAAAAVSKIQGLKAQLAGAVVQLNELLARLRTLLPPPPLPPDASAEQKQHRAMVMAKYEQDVRRLMDQINRVVEQLLEMQAKLEDIMAQLPAAQAKDAAELLRQSEQMKRHLEATAAALSTAADKEYGDMVVSKTAAARKGSRRRPVADVVRAQWWYLSVGPASASNSKPGASPAPSAGPAGGGLPLN